MHQGNKLHCSVFISLSFFFFFSPGQANFQFDLYGRMRMSDLKYFSLPLCCLPVPGMDSGGRTFSFLHRDGKEQEKVTSQLSSTYNLSRQLCQGCVWSFLKDISSPDNRIWDSDPPLFNPAAGSMPPEALSCPQQSHISVVLIPKK